MIRTAAYCRVSTDSEDQANSFETQCRFFREYIENHADWELCGVYADEGITGTNTKKRLEFRRMMTDAHHRKYDLIITKEVSRFSRNILDTIAYTRELKSLGIGVLFVTDGIHTMEPDAELRLSIMASIAQEESRRTSCRVVWGQTRQMEKGVVFGRSLLGYKVTGGKMTIEPKEAEIVRKIFHMYINERVSTRMIARRLTFEGIQTSRGGSVWSPASVSKILKNEKYTGDLVQKKTYTPDYLTHEKKTNRGEVPQIIIKDHHLPIIDRETWELTQERLKQNNMKKTETCGHSDRYTFSGKIRCGECGAPFVGRRRKTRDGRSTLRWRCATATRDGVSPHTAQEHSGCDIGKLLRDEDAWNMFTTALKSLPINLEAVVSRVSTAAIDAVLLDEKETRDASRLEAEIGSTQGKLERMMDSYFSGEIDHEEMQMMRLRYHGKLQSLRTQLDQVEQKKQQLGNSDILRDSIRTTLSEVLRGTVRSDLLCRNLLDRITVFKDKHIELRFTRLPYTLYFTESSDKLTK